MREKGPSTETPRSNSKVACDCAGRPLLPVSRQDLRESPGSEEPAGKIVATVLP